MVLLYIADDGFSYHLGKYYYTRPNAVNTEQFGKYFDRIVYLARNCAYVEGSVELPENATAYLVNKWDFPGLLRTLKEHADEYDAALLRNGMNGCISANTLKRLGKPVISYLGYEPLTYKFSQRTLAGYLEGVVWFFLERNKMAKGDYAHYCADYLTRRYPAAVPYLVCPNVEIDIDEATAEYKREKYGKTAGKRVIGMIATLNSNKGIDTAVKAVSRLPEAYELEIVGSGDKTPYERLAAKLGVQDRVRFLGYFAGRELVTSWLKDIDVYIQPSLSEGIPRAAIEAMAMACPLIVSRTIGAASWINPQWHIKPRDDRGLAEKIALMANDPSTLREQSAANFEKAKMFQPRIRNEKMDRYYDFFGKHLGERA